MQPINTTTLTFLVVAEKGQDSREQREREHRQEAQRVQEDEKSRSADIGATTRALARAGERGIYRVRGRCVSPLIPF